MKTFKIKGIGCSSCAVIIKMSLDDEGFDKVEVSHLDKSLTIPNDYLDKIEKIKKIVDKIGHYELIIND